MRALVGVIMEQGDRLDAGIEAARLIAMNNGLGYSFVIEGRGKAFIEVTERGPRERIKAPEEYQWVIERALRGGR